MINSHILLSVIKLKKKNLVLIPAITAYTILLLFFSSSALETAKSALSLCARSLIPSLFPFFVCSNLLINLGAAPMLSKLLSPVMRPLFGLNGSCALPFFLGIFSGYPVGAKTTADLYLDGGCLKSEAEKLLAFCNNSGPVFVIGAVGCGMLQNQTYGFILYLSHLFSAVTVAFTMRNLPVPIYPNSRTYSSSDNSAGFGELFANAVSASVSLTLNVCGFVLIFSTLVSFADCLGIVGALSSLGMNPDISRSIIYSFFECGGGCNAVSSANIPTALKLMLLSSAIGWSGISVHLQVLGIIKKAKLSSKLYFKGKALMTIISPLFTFIIYLLYTGKLKPVFLAESVLLFVIVVYIAGKSADAFKKAVRGMRHFRPDN